MKSCRNQKQIPEKAQGMVEFALVLPMLLLLIFGVIEVGRLLFIYSAVLTSSREAARYGSAAGDAGGNLTRYQDCSGIRAAAKRMGSLAGITDGDISISYDHGPGSTVFATACPPGSGQRVTLGDRVVVQVNAQYQPMLPLVRLTPFTISSVSRRTIIKDVNILGTPAAPGTQSVYFERASDEDQESSFTSRTVAVQLSGPSMNTVRVPITLSGTASPGDDYQVSIDGSPLSGSSGQVDLPPGETRANIVITVFDDDIDEDDESIFITLGMPLNANIGAPAVYSARIHDDDTTTVAFESAAQTLSEAATGSQGVRVVLSNPSTRDVTVPIRLSGGTAQEGQDFDLLTGSVTIPGGVGATEAFVFFNLAADDVDEDDEMLVLSMGEPANATREEPSEHTVTILDDDDPPLVAFTWASQETTELAGTLSVEIRLSAPSGKTVTVPVSLGGTAVEGQDYSLETALPVVIPAGQSTAAIRFSITEDEIDEADETLVLRLGSPENASLTAPEVHEATITNTTAPPIVAFTAAGQNAGEGAGTVTVSAQLSAASSFPVSVPFTIAGSAQQGLDFTVQPVSGRLLIPAGSSGAQLTISLVDDSLDEIDETILVTMGTPEHATKGSPAVHTLTIQDNDTASVSFSLESQSRREDLELITLLVETDIPSSRDIQVPFSLSGTAARGTDYTISASPVVIPAGGYGATITINLLDDAEDEEDETVVIRMETPVNAVQGSPAVHTAIILDNDAPACDIFEGNELSVNRVDKTITWAASNLGSSVLVLERISVDWPDLGSAAPKLDKIEFNTRVIWDGNVEFGPATVSNWLGQEADRILTSSTAPIVIGFTRELLEGSYQISYAFVNKTLGESCPVVTRSYTLTGP